MSCAISTRSLRVAVALITVTLVVLAAGQPPAQASDYGLPQVISRPSSSQQPNGPAQEVAISPGGRYILYRLDAPNMGTPGAGTDAGTPTAGGIYRYDTVTGTSELAAYGYFNDYTSTPPPVGAENASISADGRWVLFDSDCLLPGDPAQAYGQGPHHIYLRDMNAPVDSRSSYTEPLGPFTNAAAFPAHGLSADGTRFIWRTNASYPWTGYWTDTVAGVTRPISVAYDPSTDTMNPSQPLTDVTSPVLSGDGTTVVWAASYVTAATPMVPGEAAIDSQSNTATAGLLWRRVADGDRARTRRVTSPFDSENPACTAATPATVDPTPPGPCDNPQLDAATIAGYGGPGLVGSIAGLSSDGQRVAVLADGHARGSGIPPTTELYVVTMFPGQDRSAATVPLTRRLPGDSGGTAAAADQPILAATISGNGRYVVFVTARVAFPFEPPTLVGASSTVVGANELYVVDLQSQTMQLLSRTPSGAKQDQGVSPTGGQGATGGPPPGPGVTAAAVSDDGSTIAFLSSADNLVAGDANGFTDAFVVHRLPASAASDLTGPQVEQLPPAAPDLSPAPDWSLLVDGVTAGRDGTVTLTVEMPGAGSLSAIANDGGRMLAGARTTASAAGPVTLSLVPHVTGADGDAAVRRTRAVLAGLTFTPADPSAGAPIGLSVPVAFDLPAAALHAHVAALRSRGGLRVSLDAPAPGRISLLVTRLMRRRGRAVAVRLASAGVRARRTGPLQVAVRAPLSMLPRVPTARLAVRVEVRFTPAQAGPVPALDDTLFTVLPGARRPR